MVVTNEPGYYEEGAFGIRIENQMVVQDKFKGFQGFLNMTVVPYERKLFKMDLIGQNYIDYINEYHQRCLKQVGPILKEMGWFLGLDWLEKNCQHIEKNGGFGDKDAL